MNTPRRTPSSAEVATELNGLLAGLGILTMSLFPIALPGLLLFVVAPLALVAVVGCCWRFRSCSRYGWPAR
jgi:type IV secretory pathway TrbD component